MHVAFRTYVFSRWPLYVYVCPHTIVTESMPRPSIDQFEAAFVSSNDQADRLAENHEDFRLLDKMAVRALDRGAVALCLYSGSTLANVSWLATKETSRSAIDSVKFPIDEAFHGAWVGRVRTMPAYEGRGLFRYACVERFKYLLALGIDHSCTSVAESNVRSHAMSASLGCHLAGKGNLLKLLWWQWWQDRPLTQRDEEAVRKMVAEAQASRHKRQLPALE
jgi:hypothetical protein